MVVGVGLAATGELWSQANRRGKERELLWIGEQFRQAIGLYYQRTPGAIKRFPQRLEELVEDKRFLTTQRYLRKIYRDPITGKPEWGLVMEAENGIAGVYSLSSGRPVKAENFPDRFRQFVGAQRYSDWKFIYEPPAAPPAAPQQVTPGRRSS